MDVDTNLLENLIRENNRGLCKFHLHLDGKKYPLRHVSIVNSPNPVNSPTTRGGVYFADKFAYKLRGTIEDLSIIPLLTKTMLGPNTEFREIVITTKTNSQKNQRDVIIHANLTNSIQGPSKLELNMIIVKIQLG
ncbi:MAG: hypothetical protein R3237_01475 [Nitrosopumilaceae archaeon]|nr:hypothetical protein [Nitrosopumilaceae archaeon]